VRDLAWELPALVIFRVLGIPDEDVARVKAGAESRLLFMWGRPTEAEQIHLAHGMAAFWRYAEALVVDRSREPRDDFTSDLVLARDGDVPTLTLPEVTTIVYGLLMTGHETTTCLLANAFRQLLTHRHTWESICQDPTLIPNAIEEVLRLDSSVITWRRKTTQAVDIGGVAVPTNANMLLLWAPPTVIRRSSTTPTASTFTGRMPKSVSPLGMGRISAWGHPWGGWKRAWSWRN
jgi:cytochrome P450